MTTATDINDKLLHKGQRGNKANSSGKQAKYIRTVLQ